MIKRRRFTEREVLECLVRQGAIIPCKRCRIAFTVEAARTAEREHLVEIGLGGSDTVENCAYSHGDCHAVQTNGLPATTAGSSKNRIAKATQPKRIEKFQVRKRPLDADTVSEPLTKCRRCGEYPDSCSCRVPVRRSAFQRGASR
jgi:hypothetical protein